MPKYLRKYNALTEKWEIFSPTSTNDVSVSSTMFNTEEQPITNLTNVLNNIGENIETLKRNVSWLAEHGGSGGGIGNGTIGGGYKIVISQPANVKNNTLYVSTSAFSVSFRIDGARGEIVKYKVSYDDHPLNTDYSEVTTNTEILIKIDNIEEYRSGNHTLTIEAKDANNVPITTYNLSVFESSIKVTSKDITLVVGGNGVFPVYVTNKIQGVNTTVTVTNVTNNKSKFITYLNTGTTQEEIKFNFFEDLIDSNNINVGDTYQIKIGAQTKIDDNVIPADDYFINITIMGSDAFAIVIKNITGENSDEKTKYALGGNLTFSFGAYLNNCSYNYYAVKMVQGTKQYYLAGYDDNGVKTNNKQMKTNSEVQFVYKIPNDNQYEGQWQIIVDLWTTDGTITKSGSAYCVIEKSKANTFDTQIPKRNIQSNGYTLYGKWDIINDFSNIPGDASQLTSRIENYASSSTQSDGYTVSTNLNIYGTNGEQNGLITDDVVRTLRLTNNAYATAEIPICEGDNRWMDNDGFTISFTFKTDKHPYNDRTVLFMGEFEEDGSGEFKNGIKIDLEQVTWKFNSFDGSDDEKITMTAPIKQNTLTTVDFVYEHTYNATEGQYNGMAKIFINGKIYNAKESNVYRSNLPNKIYIGCACSNSNEQFNFADVNVYSLMVFSKALNDAQIVINSHNARAERDTSGSINMDAYNRWKERNFFNEDTATSKLYTNGEYQSLSFVEIKATKPPIPILWLQAPNTSKFTKEYYLSTAHENSETNVRHSGFTMYYYDPQNESNDDISIKEVVVSLQGTSTLKNKSKNLEIYFGQPLEHYTDKRTQLFQPREDWFPESQFTLKADVVDSAHANNATIGRWINTKAVEIGILEDTPPMTVVKNNPPTDTVIDNGEDKTFTEERTTPTIKHTLEGFQIILMMTFPSGEKPEILGIYSFNLGRGSYYNMGMSFLKSFSRRQLIGGEWVDKGAPAVVDYYEPYTRDKSIGDEGNAINLSEIYSYEFNSSGDESKEEYNVWSQDDLSIIRHYGDFKFNGNAGDDSEVGDGIWECLREIFRATSRIQDGKDHYVFQDGSHVQVDGKYTVSPADNVEKLVQRLSIKNAMAYYVIANTFGMVDSLGKNLTLRTWNANNAKKEDNGYNKWYTCFYDMDTALGLTNQGNETVSTTVYVDKYENLNNEHGLNTLNITFNHSDTNGFTCYNSQLWNILRSSTSIGENSEFKKQGKWDGDYYEDVWYKLRTTDGPLHDYNTFVDEFTQQTQGCGELLYNLDYTTKYLTKFENSNGIMGYDDASKLHGDRIEYIRGWLKDRFYFLDGVFAQPNKNIPDLPYYTVGIINCAGPKDGGNVKLKVNVTSPTIFTVEAGGNGSNCKYMLLPYEDTELTLPAMGGQGEKVLSFNSTQLITKLEGLKENQFQKFNSITLPSFSEIDLSGADNLKDDPIIFDQVFIYNENGEYKSDIREIDLSNTRGANNFDVKLSRYHKINKINISDSCVKTITLPSAPLSEFKFSNSQIEKLEINSQPYLSELDFGRCTKLEEISINNCQSIEELDISQLTSLKTVTISSCEALKQIICSNNNNLTGFTVEGCSTLEKIDLSDCKNVNLRIKITACPNIKTLDFHGMLSSKTIILPNHVNMVSTLNLSGCNGFTAFQYGSNGTVETYENENILDLRPFNVLSGKGLTLKGCSSLGYVKVRNEEDNPFILSSSYFAGCTNLKRVFGTVALSGTSIFNGCGKFYIREEVKENGVTVMPDNDTFIGTDDSNSGNVTNMIVNTTNLSSCFNGTNCNLYDVYYILNQCDNVTNLSSTFYGCKNVISDVNNSLHRDIFKHCGKVTTMSSLFYQTKVGGVLKSCTFNNDNTIKDNGILTPCYSLTNLNNTFNTSATLYTDDKFFYKCKDKDKNEVDLKLTSITYFSPIMLADSNKPGITDASIADHHSAGSSTHLFTYLPKLTSISYSFNKGSYYFNVVTATTAADTYHYTDLFYNNTGLISLENVFNGITGYGTLRNLFGGYRETVSETSHFPQKLATIANSFIIDKGSVTMLIGNSFLQKIKDTIKYITGSQIKQSTTTKTSSFNGDKLIKYIDKEGDNSVVFPYKIFNGCTQLEEVPALLRGLKHDSVHDGPEITLPVYKNEANQEVSMFDGLTKLTNISYLFSNMSGFQYTLKGGGFKDCSLVNVEGLFASPSYNNLNGNIMGSIPYGLFLQEKMANYISVTGITKDTAEMLGIDNEGYGIDNINDTDINEDGTLKKHNNSYQNYNTKPDGDKYIYKMDDKGAATTDKLSDEDDVLIIPTATTVHSGTYKTINTTIKNMSRVFEYSAADNMEHYTCDINGNNIAYDDTTQEYKCPDLIVDNENYNPILYFINEKFNPYKKIKSTITGDYSDNPNYDPRRVIKNPNYDPYKKKWNKWVGDGTDSLYEAITASTLYQEITAGTNMDISSGLPIELCEGYIQQNAPLTNDINNAASTRFKTRNYFCAPDIFRYCNNALDTKIDGAFYDCGGPDISRQNYSQWATAIEYGLYGVMPPYLFEPVTNIESLNDIFHGVQSILPYKWGTANEDGQMYHSDLLKGLKKLKYINGMFESTRVYNKCVIPNTLFNDNMLLQEAQRLFKDTLWDRTNKDTPQIDENMFSKNTKLINVSQMFMSSDNYGNNRFPYKMFKIFTPNKHKSITNCSQFLYNAKADATGNVPEFWTWSPPISSIGSCYPTSNSFNNIDDTNEAVKKFLHS